MISKVVLRNFKRFKEVTFDLPGHVVLAGPNNSGKTTLLQAIAAWDLALQHWRSSFPVKRAKGQFERVPIARQAFVSVPLRVFDLLWHQRAYREAIEIEVHGEQGWRVCMEIAPDTTEQVYLRPIRTSADDLEASKEVRTVYIPPSSGLQIEEGLYANPRTIDAFLARGRAGDVLRNILFEASNDSSSWSAIQEAVRRLFGTTLEPPDGHGAFLLSDYREQPGSTALDLMSSGSGFQQVLLLLCFLHTRPGRVLLLDEPDAHLHVILQDVVYDELLSVAGKTRSQLVIATHSEIIINAADIGDIRLSFDPSRALLGEPDRKALRQSLHHLSNVDIVQAKDAPGILYLEDYTDLEILREWARILEHRAYELLTTKAFWRRTVVESGEGIDAVQAKEHYESLRLVRADLPGLVLVDGDAQKSIESTPITGKGLQRLRWRRYEIESYLVHPAALARFVQQRVGGPDGATGARAVLDFFQRKYPPDFVANPLGEHEFLQGTKARTSILPQALTAGGLPAFPYQRFHEIAASMHSEEIHPEVREKLDLLCKAFGVKP